jgi:hypothetical protein
VGVAGRCSRTCRLLAAALASCPTHAAGRRLLLAALDIRGGDGHGPDGSTKPCTMGRRSRKGQGPAPTREGLSRPADEWAALPARRVVASVDGRAAVVAVFLQEETK